MMYGFRTTLPPSFIRHTHIAIDRQYCVKIKLCLGRAGAWVVGALYDGAQYPGAGAFLFEIHACRTNTQNKTQCAYRHDT